MDKSIVTIIGGLTIDLIYRVDDFPVEDQAVQAKSYALVPGGKGLNQATSCARMGFEVQLFGSVGDDNFADKVFDALRQEGIDNRHIIRQKNVLTDLVGVLVNKDGTPAFIGIRNATSKLTASDIEKNKSLITKSKVLLVNSEVSNDVIVRSLEIAKKAGVTTMFNPAPPIKLPPGVLKLVDFFIPNEWEARVLFGSKKRFSTRELAEAYRKRGAKTVIITQGENGGVIASKDGTESYPAFSVSEVDVTGAGDAFCAALVYSITQNWEFHKGIKFAAAAGALACLKEGARNSQPTHKQVFDFLNKRR